MEFPNLGQHCNLTSCSRLGIFQNARHSTLRMRYLIMKICDSDEHWRPDKHQCISETFDNTRTHQCPICNVYIQPVRNQNPNATMDEHISSGCKKHKTRKAIPNKCSMPGCKITECAKCNKNFCLKHRHSDDHRCGRRNSSSIAATNVKNRTQQCPEETKQQITSARQIASHRNVQRRGNRPTLANNGFGAFLNRQRQERAAIRMQQHQEITPQPSIGNVLEPSGLSDEEALQVAIQASLAEQTSQPQANQPEASHQVQRRQQQQKSQCNVS
eukprot:gene4079-6486_t